MPKKNVEIKSSTAVNQPYSTVASENLSMVKTVLQAMGDLNQHAVFLGGAILPLFLTKASDLPVRKSKDIDCIVEFEKKQQLLEFEDKLWDRGFEKLRNDVVTKWKLGPISMDVMPGGPVVEFNNRWLFDAHSEAITVNLEKTLSLKIVPARYFCAIKFNSYYRRGRNDYSKSFDIYDLLVLLAGRAEIEQEIVNDCTPVLKKFLSEEFEKLLKSKDALASLLQHFSPGTTSVQRNHSLITSRIKAITKKL